MGGYGALRLLSGATQEGRIPWPLRRALETNEIAWSELFRKGAEAPIFDRSQRSPNVRENGGIGLKDPIDLDRWRLIVENVSGHAAPIVLTLDDIKALPRHEFTAQFCCIEGWSMIVTWAGARFSDFAAKYMPPTQSGEGIPSLAKPQDLVRYVYMESAMQGPMASAPYFVGLDMQSVLHPQTLLCYEMNGQPLTQNHGAPLRLVIPVKYGVKNIKRIGKIRYADEKPPDYWAERGYDWFCGL